MPTSADLPPIRVFFEELGNVHGAFGAKGIGELPMDGPAPAIVNAAVDSLGIPFDSIRLLAEDVFEALTAQASPPGEPQLTGGRRCPNHRGKKIRARASWRTKSKANPRWFASIPWNACSTCCVTSST